MRRLEDDSRTVPFKILGGNVQSYLSPSPPPSAVSEPYRIATPSSTSSRAHRRSSFVIIVEARPETPTSRSPSLSLASGRVSPFRGRGFKGPPPHAQSRPQTPEKNERQRPGRVERRISISQQNSPKHAPASQPTRRRSVSLTKPEVEKPSPKYGRRATGKNSLGVKSTAPERKASLKVPDLSPIHGTPTKPSDRKSALAVPDQYSNAAAKRTSPSKSRRNSTQLPPKGLGGTKTPSKPSKVRRESIEAPLSPSRIPVKQGSLPPKVPTSGSRRGSLSHVTAKVNSYRTTEKTVPDKSSEKSTVSSDPSSSSKSKQKSNSSASTAANGSPNDNVVSPESVKHLDDEPSLIDLLKQTSGASGTSSVVNTTTVTAVQPLQIDAIALLDQEASRIDNDNKENRKNITSARKGGQSKPATGDSSSTVSTPHGKPQPAQNGSQKPTKSNGTTSKNGSQGETIRNGIKEPKVPESTQVDPSTASKNHQNQDAKTINNDANDGNQNGHRGNGTANGTSQNTRDVNGKTSNGHVEASMGNRTPGVTRASGVRGSGTEQPKNPTSGQHRTENNAHHGVRSDENTRKMESPRETNRVRDTKNDAQRADGQRIHSSRQTDVRATENSASGRPGINTTTTPINSVKSVIITNNVSNAVVGMHRTNNLGSDVSLKSSAGISTGSTDTGVSVNTVRGVSSAREKRGTHTVKKSETIETLSGNVTHLEQNGEPTLLPATPSNQLGVSNVSSTPAKTSCWQRFVRYCSCCCCCGDRRNGMKCPACRRGLKAAVPQWNSQAEPTQRSTNRLSKLKPKERCCRWPTWKCCSRESRVAPAEGTSCCPPERGCKAFCGRIFGRCACKREEAQRTRNVEAKQSLTSIVAPPIPEEPKVKLPEVLVEHNALMRGAIPCLPIPLAWFCLVFNVLIPGSGTIWSGLFNLCTGQPRFSPVAGPRARIGALLVNIVVGLGQLFTVLFCLVGWGWSIWWGVMMVRLARKYKRFRDSEAANNDVEARGAAESSNLPPGVPNQVLRSFERAR